MTQPLFIEPFQYIEKTAAETELPEDPNQWPQEVLQELYKQVPYVADFEPHVQMDKVDGERGYGLGHVQVANKSEMQMGTPPDQQKAAGIRQVRLPVVIKNGKLMPFDLLITDDAGIRPLTEGRLRQSVFRPQPFDVTGRTPGDQSMIGQLYPPYRQNYGFGGGGVSIPKESSALEQYLEKNAAAIDEYFASEGIKHGRLGKKTSEGELGDGEGGNLTDFVEKNAEVKTAVSKKWVAQRTAKATKKLLSESGGYTGAARERLRTFRSRLMQTEGRAGQRRLKDPGVDADKPQFWTKNKRGQRVATPRAIAHVGRVEKRDIAEKAVAKHVQNVLKKTGSVEKNAAAKGVVSKFREAAKKLKPTRSGKEIWKEFKETGHPYAAIGLGTGLAAGGAGAAVRERAKEKNSAAKEKPGIVARYKEHLKAVPADLKAITRPSGPRSWEKQSSVLNAILPTINESDYTKLASAMEEPDVQAALMKNRHAMSESLGILSQWESNRTKLASALSNFVRPTVVQVIRDEGSYKIKTANHKFWDPAEEHIDRGELVHRFGEKVALAADTEGAVTMADGEGVAEAPETDADMESAGPVSEYGVYKVQDTEGNEHIGVVIPNLIDVTGETLPLSLFTNGSVAAVQADIMGKEAGQAFELPSSEDISGYGVFYTTNGESVIATIPLTISGSAAGPEGPVDYQAETFDGRPVMVSVQPNIQSVVGTEDGKMLIPENWQWMNLDAANEVALVGDEAEENHEDEAKQAIASVEIRAGGYNSFSIDGIPIDKVAEDQRHFVDIDSALFLLSGLGVNHQYAITKLGQAAAQREPIRVRIGRTIKTAEQQKRAAVDAAVARQLVNMRKDLLKEAAVIPDPVAVDTVLSLGFINPENITTFVSYLPSLESAQGRMCELLLASRLGLQAIPTSALERAIRSTEEVIEGLKVLAFQG